MATMYAMRGANSVKVLFRHAACASNQFATITATHLLSAILFIPVGKHPTIFPSFLFADRLTA